MLPTYLQFSADKINYIQKKLKEKHTNQKRNTEKCTIYKTGIVIQPDGKLRPCIPFTKNTNLSIFTDDYNTVLNESKLLHNKYYIFDKDCKHCKEMKNCACPIIISLFGKNKNIKCKNTKQNKIFKHNRNLDEDL